jgi:hypothetical protein
MTTAFSTKRDRNTGTAVRRRPDDPTHPVKAIGTHAALARATQPGPDEDSVPYSGIQRAALTCLAALVSTAIWAGIFRLCSWLLEAPIGPVLMAGILIGIFLFQFFALNLLAGASHRPDLNNTDGCCEGHGAGITTRHCSAHGSSSRDA